MKPQITALMRSAWHFRVLGGLRILLMLISLGLSSLLGAVEGQFSGVSTKGNLSVWRVNHDNGSVSLCSFEGHRNAPVCYPWSAPAKGGNYAIVPGDDVLSTWRIDTSSGGVSLCEYKEMSESPVCTPWSQP